MIIVADTTPLIYLAKLGQLGILQQLYGNVVIPTEVWRELVAKKHNPERAALLRAATWLHVDPSADASPLLPELQKGMDNGEAAAVALALHLHGDLVLVDDLEGRRGAEARGLRVRGTIGILIAARKAGLIPVLRPVLEALQATNFRADPKLYRRALEQVGEEPG